MTKRKGKTMIKWGFIGCGDVVENKSGKPFWLDGKSTVDAVMCRNIDSAKDFAKRYNIKNYYNDVDILLANEDIDVVYIATPPSTHMMYAKKAIMAKKSVYVEKPMGINTQECMEVLELANKNKVSIFVAYYRRALPYFQDIKNMVDSGEIGEIRTVNIMHYAKKPANDDLVWRRDPEISGGGLFHDLGCHTLDILDYIISPISEVYGTCENQRKLFKSVDSVCASFKFENGVLGTGLWCFDVNEKNEKVQIIGNDGMIEFSVYGNEIKLIKNTTKTLEYKHPSFIQEPMIHNVIFSLMGEKEALSTGNSAIRTTQIIEKITE